MLQQLHAEKGAAKGLGPGPDGDEANVILAQQCYSRQFNSSYSSINPSVLYRTPHCGVDVNSTFLTVAYPPILGDLASYILTRRTMMQSLGTRLSNNAYPILSQLTWFQAL